MRGTRLTAILGIVVIAVLAVSIFAYITLNPNPISSGGGLQVEWQQFLPGITGKQIIETSDGGFLALGTTADISNSDPREPIFVNEQPILIKTDSLGNVQWQKTFQVLGLTPTLSNIAQTRDGGYVVVGGITNNSAINTPFSRFCLIKLDYKGNVNWTQTYRGGSDANNDALNTVLETSDGYTLFGTWSRYWDYHGFMQGYLIKTDEAGNAFFSKGVAAGPASSMVQISDGYIFFTSRQASGGGTKFMLLKTDFNGAALWLNDYQGIANSAYETCGVPTSDGGYLLGGSLVSPDKGWLVKTDAEGKMLWNKTYDETTTMNSVAQTQDGGFVVSGSITYINPKDNGKSSGIAWIAKTDGLGNVETHVTIGQNATFHYTYPSSVFQIGDEEFVCVGTWDQTIQASSSQRFWIAKLY